MTTAPTLGRTVIAGASADPAAGMSTGSQGAAPTSGHRDVHLVGLTVSYRKGERTVTPVADLSLYAPASRITALVGPSGSGKTSVLSCIAGLMAPASGTIWLGGIAVNRLQGKALDHFRRTHVGVVHQAYNLIPSLTAIENVVVPLSLIGVSHREATARATGLLDRLGLGSVHRHRPGQLSGGQQQRVALARALATNPSVVLADEPTAHLDGTSISEVRDLLRAVAAEGRTVIVSTHDDRLLSSVDQTVVIGAQVPSLL